MVSLSRHSNSLHDKKDYSSTANTASCVYSDILGGGNPIFPGCGGVSGCQMNSCIMRNTYCNSTCINQMMFISQISVYLHFPQLMTALAVMLLCDSHVRQHYSVGMILPPCSASPASGLDNYPMRLSRHNQVHVKHFPFMSHT